MGHVRKCVAGKERRFRTQPPHPATAPSLKLGCPDTHKSSRPAMSAMTDSSRTGSARSRRTSHSASHAARCSCRLGAAATAARPFPMPSQLAALCTKRTTLPCGGAGGDGTGSCQQSGVSAAASRPSSLPPQQAPCPAPSPTQPASNPPCRRGSTAHHQSSAGAGPRSAAPTGSGRGPARARTGRRPPGAAGEGKAGRGRFR